MIDKIKTIKIHPPKEIPNGIKVKIDDRTFYIRGELFHDHYNTIQLQRMDDGWHLTYPKAYEGTVEIIFSTLEEAIIYMRVNKLTYVRK